MMIKRKIWKSIGAIILLLMFYANAMATEQHNYDGVNITIQDDGIAVVSLSKSGAIGKDENFYGPGKIRNLPWDQVNSIQFKSVNDAIYNNKDWEAIAQIINMATPDEKTVALDFSEIIIADELFAFQGVANKSKITSVVMPRGLTTLAVGAFNGCTSLNNVGWSPALTSISNGAFNNTGFTSITIPEGVTSIGNEAFAFCKSLGSITFPATLQTVGLNVIMESPVIALYSRNPTPPEALGDFSTADSYEVYNTTYSWNIPKNEFDFYSECILYVEPSEEVIERYSNAPYWQKFFIKDLEKIYLRPTDLERPQVTGVQQLVVTSPNVNNGVTATVNINTVYVRSMDANKWYTIMLPFEVSYDKLQEVFGEETQVWGYSGVYNNTLCFDQPVTESVIESEKRMKADTPYLIKPSVAKGEYEFNGQDVIYTQYDANPSPSLAVPGGQDEQYTSTFQGTYTNQKIPTYAYYLKNNRFYYMPGGNTSLGWKAYGGIVYVNDGSNVEGTNVNVFDLAVGHSGDASVIKSCQMETKASDQPLYNLAGQLVRQPKRGIYVRNGKKIIIK